MNYIGIDLHRRFSQTDVYDDETDTEITQRLTNDQEVMRNFFQSFPPDSRVTVEATGNWYWLVDLLQQLQLDVALANPLQTKVIAHARVKNDKVDARMLNHLRRTDLLPTCWIPDQQNRNARDLLRNRLRLVVFSLQYKNVIRAILAKFNINLEIKNIWSGTGRSSLDTVITPNERAALTQISLPSPYCEIIRQILQHIDLLAEQIEGWHKIIDRQIAISAEAQRLMTFPGIGRLSALTILYETGPINRFPSAKHYASYVGLVPRTMMSADKHHHGHLFKQANMYLKRIYIEIAINALRTKTLDGWLRNFHTQVMKKKGKGIARVALARKITGLVYHMLKNNLDYQTVIARNKMAG